VKHVLILYVCQSAIPNIANLNYQHYERMNQCSAPDKSSYVTYFKEKGAIFVINALLVTARYIACKINV